MYDLRPIAVERMLLVISGGIVFMNMLDIYPAIWLWDHLSPLFQIETPYTDSRPFDYSTISFCSKSRGSSYIFNDVAVSNVAGPLSDIIRSCIKALYNCLLDKP